MVIILSIETASTNCSVALSKNGKNLAVKEDYNTQYSHAERLHVFIAQILEKNAITPNQLTAIAVSKGPGSYTGLRIGVSAAKGLCYALDIPLISVSTLEALAHQVSVPSGFIIPLLDARRMEVYSAVFSSEYKAIREIKAEVIDATSFARYLEQDKVYFIGNGVAKTAEVISHKHAIFKKGKLPSARTISSIAYAKYVNNDLEDVAYFEPYYLKDFIAIKPKKRY